MGRTGAMEDQKILVVRAQDAFGGARKGQLLLVGSTQWPCFCADGDVDAMPPQTMSDGMVDVLIQSVLASR